MAVTAANVAPSSAIGSAGVVRSERALLVLLVAATALGPLSLQILLPALPIIQDSFGIGAAAAQLPFSLSAIAIALATLAYGPASDRYGRRPVMLTGLGLFLVGSAACAVAPGIGWLVAGRVVQAAGACVGMVLSRAVIRDLYDRERSAQLIAYVTTAMVVAPMVAPALGGFVAHHWGWRMIFVVGGGAGLLVLAFALITLRETAANLGAKHDLASMLASFATLLRRPAFRGYAIQGAFSLSVFFSFLAAAPYLMTKVYGRTAYEYGIWFIVVSLAFMVGNFIAARLTPSVGLERMVVIGSAGGLAATACALALVSFGVWTPLALFGPMAASALCQGLALSNTQAAIVSIEPRLAGAASGLSGFAQMIVAGLVAQLVGSVQDGTPWPMVVGMVTCSAVALAGALVAVSRR